MRPDPSTLAVYIHWPYCTRICPYCDFNVYKQKKNPALLEAILSDLAAWREWTGPRKITSVHFGGGTPSLMPAGDIARCLSTIGSLWGLGPDVEIALEANPSDHDATYWRDLKSHGVNRLSLGVQSFDDAVLKFLGRNHDGASAIGAAQDALDVFPSVSFDLIFGWAGQTAKHLDSDINTLLDFSPQHVSSYQLTIEPDTAFDRAEARGVTKAVDSDQSADLYDHVCDRLVAAGYDHYEVSNFSKPGHASRHNLTYWHGGDYVGVGPGAHGRLSRAGRRFATVTPLTPQDYQTTLNPWHAGDTRVTELGAEAWSEEYLFMGLRLSDGISLSRYESLSGKPLSPSVVKTLVTDGWLAQMGDKIHATRAGRAVLNRLIDELLIN